MKTPNIGFMALALMAVLGAVAVPQVARAVYVDGSQEEAKPFVIKGQLSVRFTDDVVMSAKTRSFGRVAMGVPAIDAVFQRHNVLEVSPVFPWRSEFSAKAEDRMMSRFQRLDIPLDADMDALILELMASGNVVSAEKIMAMPLLGVGSDDPENEYAPNQIRATDVWPIEPGSDTAKFGAIDSGVMYRHEDLASQVWVNPGEDLDGDGEPFDLDDLNGIDDDGNGVIDDLIGYDFFTGLGGGVWPGEDAGVPDPDPVDFNGHGTHTAGTAAASTNNAIGVAGIAGGWNANGVYATRGPRIMCMRVGATGADGRGYVNTNDCATAIDYCANMGVSAISCSWGSSNLSSLVAALNLATANGVVIAKSAGNAGGTPTEQTADYMGTRLDVIAVASTDAIDMKSGFSSFGAWVEISAPGTAINSTWSNGGYNSISGTSMASPAYAGAALLIKSLMPGWTKVEIDPLLLSTADDIDGINPGLEGLLGSGRLNVFNAIANLPIANFSATIINPSPLSSSGIDMKGTQGMEVQFTDASPNTPSAWSWTFGDGAVSSAQDPTHVYNDVGLYDVTLEVTEPNGTGFEQAKRLVLIHADTLGGDTGGASIGQEVLVPVYLRNNFPVKSMLIPFDFTPANGVSLTYTGFSTTGLRTEYFEIQEASVIPIFQPRGAVLLGSDLQSGHSNYLPPGAGPVVYLHFIINGGSTPGAVMPINTATIGGGNDLNVETLHGSISPFLLPSMVEVEGCCVTPGDANSSGSFNIADPIFVIAMIFSEGPSPVCADQGDANGNGTVNIADAVYGIATVFSDGPEPVCGSTGM